MSDYSFLSESGDEDEVENLLNQAMDHAVLEQVAKINCSSFSADSVLPTHLENRFSRLKSFPVTNPKSPNLAKFNSDLGKSNEKKLNSESGSDNLPSKSVEKTVLSEKVMKSRTGLGSNSPDSSSGSDNLPTKSVKRTEMSKKVMKSGAGSGANSPDPSSGYEIFSPLRENSRRRKSAKSKSQADLSDLSPSPPKKSGCFWCSPKRVSRKNSKNGDEFFSDLGIFKDKKQEKWLEKAMREEEKISREAEKIVKWAKQESSKMMNISDLEDELSDNDKFNTK